jgi:hypothetical protein
MRSVFLMCLLSACACDGGSPIDAGRPPDGHCPDGGVDAGMDGGRDAGLDAGAGDPIDFFALLADPYAPARARPGCMELASSREVEPPEGNQNSDHNVYLRVDGDESVMVEEEGPGVVTRIWFTLRYRPDGTQDIADTTVMHLYVDGTEIELGSAARGVTLGELGSGTLPGFERPWVAGRDTASGAIQCLVPIHYQDSVRITVEEPAPDTLLYYQVDLRELPENARVRSFDGSLTAAERESLDRATALWVDRTLDARATADESMTVPAGESITITIDEPTIVRRLAVTSDALASLTSALTIDGELVIDAPLLSWMYAPPPSEPYASALSVSAPDRVELLYPSPARARVEWVVRNTSETAVPIALTVDHDPGVPADDLGSLRVVCGAPMSTEVGTNVRLVDIQGARGHFAGQWLVSHGSMWGFTVLEGDHEFLIDGEWAILGTGVEDYFGGSFYYANGAFALPQTGASGIERLAAGATIAFQYRHHIIDTIPFENSFAFDYEAFEPGSTFEHCSYWYEYQ